MSVIRGSVSAYKGAAGGSPYDPPPSLSAHPLRENAHFMAWDTNAALPTPGAGAPYVFDTVTVRGFTHAAGVFTVPEDGVYLLTATAEVSAGTPNIAFRINAGSIMSMTPSAQESMSILRALSAGDTVQLFENAAASTIQGSAGGTVALSSFQCVRVA